MSVPVPEPSPPTILVTGASGYVGGRLVRALSDRGIPCRCLTRRPEILATRLPPDTELTAGDVLDPASLKESLRGIHTAYYLIHALGSSGDFESQEVAGARNFATVCRDAGVQRIIYLGGLCHPNEDLSPHLRSRLRVGEELRQTGVETIEFRASIIIGSGSLSFELIRALVRKLPIMITPRWVSVPAQPIAINDVLEYLLATLDLPPAENRVIEIGGRDIMSYGDLMQVYGQMRGLHRRILRVPVLTPNLSSLWLSLVTPVYARVGRKLIESMTSPSVVRDPSALDLFDIRPMNVETAIEQALRNEDREFAETHWSDALSTLGARPSWGGVSFGPRLVDSRSLKLSCTPVEAFEPVLRIGGRTGWYYGNWLWKLRGLIDRACGGVGMGRGRRDPVALRVGDVVDCWRVESLEPPYRLSLRAEMKLPGRAWLDFEVSPESQGCSLTQTASYDPVGLLGLLYWYALYPAHQFVFAGMLRNLGATATSSQFSGNMSGGYPIDP